MDDPDQSLVSKDISYQGPLAVEQQGNSHGYAEPEKRSAEVTRSPGKKPCSPAKPGSH